MDANLVIFPMVVGFITLFLFIYVRSKANFKKIDGLVVIGLCGSLITAGMQLQPDQAESMEKCLLKNYVAGCPHHICEPLTRVFFSYRLYIINEQTRGTVSSTAIKALLATCVAFMVFCSITYPVTVKAKIIDEVVCAAKIPYWYVFTFFGGNSVLDIVILFYFIQFLRQTLASPDITRLMRVTAISTFLSLAMSIFTTVYFLFVFPTSIILSYEAVFNAIAPAAPVIFIHYKKVQAAVHPKSTGAAQLPSGASQKNKSNSEQAKTARSTA